MECGSQGSANYSVRAKSCPGPLPVSVIKFYWNTAMLTCLCIIYGYFHIQGRVEYNCEYLYDSSLPSLVLAFSSVFIDNLLRVCIA